MIEKPQFHTIQITVSHELYEELVEKRGERTWVSFLYDNLNNME